MPSEMLFYAFQYFEIDYYSAFVMVLLSHHFQYRLQYLIYLFL